MLDHQPPDLCGLCGADHDGQCPDTAPPAPYVDTRPRAAYRLPSGEIVRVICDHGEIPASEISYQIGIKIVTARLETPGAFARPRDASLLALLYTYEAVATTARYGLQLAGDDAADALATYAHRRGLEVTSEQFSRLDHEGRTITWTRLSIELPSGASISASRDDDRPVAPDPDTGGRHA